MTTSNLYSLASRADMCAECDSETCAFNPNGICGFPLLYGRAPRLSDDGCADWVFADNGESSQDDGHIPMDDFTGEMKVILAGAVGRDYAHYLASGDFAEDVRSNVEETSAWQDEGYYTDDDIRLAIGRVLMGYLGVSYE